MALLELLLCFISIPIMIGISIIVAYFMMHLIFYLFEKHDTWNRGDNC